MNVRVYPSLVYITITDLLLRRKKNLEIDTLSSFSGSAIDVISAFSRLSSASIYIMKCGYVPEFAQPFVVTRLA